jgi:polysaccharide biosynthesis transport protein
MNADLTYYLSLFWRRFHYFLVFALSGLAIGVTLALTLPPVYRAQARLSVESSQIPGDLALSTVRASAVELLEVITQRLVTRSYLLDTAARFGLYKDQPEATPDAIADDMQSRLTLALPGLLDPAPIASVAFKAEDPQVAADIVNDLVTKILQENTAVRRGLAEDTLGFFEQEVKRLDGEIARQGRLILEFKEKHKTALPDSLEFRRLRQTAQQERLVQLDRELSSLKDRRARLEEIFARTGQVDSLTDNRSDEQRQLQLLKSQLASAKILYSPDNPVLKSLAVQVEALQAAVDAQLEGRNGGNSTLTTFEMQLADIDAQISFLVDQKKELDADLVELQASIEATPQNAIALGTLERDYANIQLQYNQAADRLSQASTGDRIEAQSRGQRITVIEPAEVPSTPVSPKRKLLTVGGLGAGAALGMGLIVLLELLNRTIRRPVQLTAGLGITPFATVPLYYTRREMRHRRMRVWSGVLMGLALVAGALYAVHVFYWPLDLLLPEVAAKFGIGSGVAVPVTAVEG